MNPYVELGLVVMIPTAAGYGLIYSVRGLTWAAQRWPRPRPAEPEQIDRLTATLRRLRADLESLETRTGVPSKHVRLRALRGAYLDVLGTACRQLAVTPPQGSSAQSFDQADIYRVESALRERGVDVREPATR